MVGKVEKEDEEGEMDIKLKGRTKWRAMLAIIIIRRGETIIIRVKNETHEIIHATIPV